LTAPGAGIRDAAVLVCAVVAFVMSASIGSREPRHERSRELAVRIPLVFQIVTAAGDRYLAANLAGFRVLVSESYRMDLQELRLQAQLQRDVSWLNPAHEDNYYIAAAILSLPELIPAAQFILRRAADARPRDWQPLFYYGFNRYFFEKNPAAGAQALLEAVPRMGDEAESWAMQNLAARWIERGYSAGEAARIVGGMADSANPGRFKRYLSDRARRLRDLAMLKEAAQRFRDSTGRPPASLDELLTAKLIERIPEDPFRRGYTLDSLGEPVFAQKR
jgi:hypothetical protein